MRNKDLFLILSVYLFSFVYLSSSLSSAFGVPVGGVSPVCSSLGEFEAKFNVNGFLPNSFVGWEFLGPDGVRTMHGFFATNSTGGFEEDAELESIIEGEHTMFIYDDIEHDYVADQKGNSAKITIQVPCR